MTRATIHSALAQLKARLGLDQMSARERNVLLIGGLVVAAVLVSQLIVSPYLEARKRLEDLLERKQTELQEIRELSREYVDLRAEEGGIKTQLAQRDPAFTLFAFLDQRAEEAEVKGQIKYMKPSVAEGDSELDESIVEMRLEGVSLEKLVEFLRLTESDANVVFVRRLSVQASARTEGLLDVILQFVTLVEAG